jgi:ribosomal protein L7Ae-like RNA K-turn-binding protein
MCEQNDMLNLDPHTVEAIENGPEEFVINLEDVSLQKSLLEEEENDDVVMISVDNLKSLGYVVKSNPFKGSRSVSHFSRNDSVKAVDFKPIINNSDVVSKNDSSVKVVDFKPPINNSDDVNSSTTPVAHLSRPLKKNPFMRVAASELKNEEMFK